MADRPKAEDYKGLDNRDLKALTMESWEIPRPLRNPVVREIMAHIPKMEPGQVIRAYKGNKEEARRLQSAVLRLVHRHELGVKVVVRGPELYLQKPEG